MKLHTVYRYSLQGVLGAHGTGGYLFPRLSPFEPSWLNSGGPHDHSGRDTPQASLQFTVAKCLHHGQGAVSRAPSRGRLSTWGVGSSGHFGFLPFPHAGIQTAAAQPWPWRQEEQAGADRAPRWREAVLHQTGLDRVPQWGKRKWLAGNTLDTNPNTSFLLVFC